MELDKHNILELFFFFSRDTIVKYLPAHLDSFGLIATTKRSNVGLNQREDNRTYGSLYFLYVDIIILSGDFGGGTEATDIL